MVMDITTLLDFFLYEDIGEVEPETPPNPNNNQPPSGNGDNTPDTREFGDMFDPDYFK